MLIDILKGQADLCSCVIPFLSIDDKRVLNIPAQPVRLPTIDISSPCVSYVSDMYRNISDEVWMSHRSPNTWSIIWKETSEDVNTFRIIVRDREYQYLHIEWPYTDESTKQYWYKTKI